MTVAAIIILIFLVIMIVVSAINVIAETRLTGDMPYRTPRCSILIPARNEEENLEALLTDLQAQSYPELEVWVYDDQSTDATAGIVNRFEKQDARFHGMTGGELPEGWNGKNHACHRLAEQASGDYLLFLDADVRTKFDMVAKAVDYLQRRELQMVSVFPRQIMRSIGERITVPLMNWILVSLLPLPLVRRTSFPSLSAANGQCMLFDAKTYYHHQWHAFHKREAVEDIAIARSMKSHGYRVQTLLGDASVSCRMYRNYGEAVEGFAKNIHAYFGNSYLLMLLFVAIVVGGFVPVIMSYGIRGGIAMGGLMVANRWIVSRASGQPTSFILLLPFQLAALVHIAGRNLFQGITGNLNWKGRTVST